MQKSMQKRMFFAGCKIEKFQQSQKYAVKKKHVRPRHYQNYLRHRVFSKLECKFTK